MNAYALFYIISYDLCISMHSAVLNPECNKHEKEKLYFFGACHRFLVTFSVEGKGKDG
jgi:hypothetical protein